MTHFTVLVVLPQGTSLAEGPLNAALGEVLAPWDENKECPKHKVYESEHGKTDPNDFWFVRSARRNAADFHNGTGILPYDPDEPWSTASQYPPEVQREEQRKDVEAALRLGLNPTWADVVAASNWRWGNGGQLALPAGTGVPGSSDGVEVDDDDDVMPVRDDYSAPMLYDAATGRAFEWTRSNPHAKWDWWVVGGRWGGDFTAKDGASPSDIIPVDRHYWSGPKDLPRQACNGGVLEALDIELLYRSAFKKAVTDYDAWEELRKRFPDDKPRSAFPDGREGGEAWRGQPLVKAAEDRFGLWLDCPFELFGDDRDGYIRYAVSQSIPGYALVTLEGEWMAPGDMGWFGFSSDERADRMAHKERVLTYLDSLPRDVVLVLVDCHI
jgi:hypothetical protein